MSDQDLGLFQPAEQWAKTFDQRLQAATRQAALLVNHVMTEDGVFMEKDPQPLLSVFINVDDKEYSLAYDLSENGLTEPLTEDKLRKCYLSMLPSLTKVLRDHGKIV